MKKIKPYFTIALIIGTLIFVKVRFFASDLPKGGAAGKGAKDGKKPSTPVTVFVVGTEKLENKIYANGTLVANEAAELKPEGSGRIIYLNLPEGKQVKAGALLLKINDSEFRAQMIKSEAQLKLAVETEKRQRKLFEIQGINKQDYEITLANLASLKSDSAYLRTQMDKTEIYAPFNGVIGIRNVSKGSYITPAITVAEIHQIDPIKVEFTLPEKYAYFFNEGDEIRFTSEGANTSFSAKINVKDPLVDINSRSIRYRAITKNPKGLLLPGAFVRVELTIKENKQTWFVPTEAIVPVAKGKKIFIVKEGLAEDKLVETGLRTEDYIQVLSGVLPGDSVVVNGNFQLKKGSAVKVKSPKSEGKKLEVRGEKLDKKE